MNWSFLNKEMVMAMFCIEIEHNKDKSELSTGQ